MAVVVRFSEDPAWVLDTAGGFLEHEPVHHNLVLSLLLRCVSEGARGQFWVVGDDGAVAGIVFRWPAHFFATVTPMTRPATIAAVDAIVAAGVMLPGVNGDAATAATFAGRWSERTRRPARPVLAQRLYELGELASAPDVGGWARPATGPDDALVVEWFRAFGTEIHQPFGAGDDAVVRARVDRGEVWLWCDPDPVSLVAATPPCAGAVRIGPVYTPPGHRGRGAASALVHHRSAGIRADGHQALLYTELENPTSNAIYQAIGYRAVAEITRYELDAAS